MDMIWKICKECYAFRMKMGGDPTQKCPGGECKKLKAEASAEITRLMKIIIDNKMANKTR